MNEVRSYNEVMSVINETECVETLRTNYKYICDNKYNYPLVQLWFAKETYFDRFKELMKLKFSMN